MRRPHLPRLIFLALAVLPGAGADDFHRLRGDIPIIETAPAPPVATHEKPGKRRGRSYPEQPPTIPHSIAGYEISLRGNKCLSCHSRRRFAETGAPMASISHFTGRNLQVLSDISPRRYFCTQCHVPQTSAAPPVGSDFIDGADLPAE